MPYGVVQYILDCQFARLRLEHHVSATQAVKFIASGSESHILSPHVRQCTVQMCQVHSLNMLGMELPQT